uniref:Carboxypeptidase n=1 Tax=Aegilops tauschii subsp. strangulata TaxID=200361 RepID=A0A453CGV6_AEGTS
TSEQATVISRLSSVPPHDVLTSNHLPKTHPTNPNNLPPPPLPNLLTSLLPQNPSPKLFFPLPPFLNQPSSSSRRTPQGPRSQKPKQSKLHTQALPHRSSRGHGHGILPPCRGGVSGCRRSLLEPAARGRPRHRAPWATRGRVQALRRLRRRRNGRRQGALLLVLRGRAGAGEEAPHAVAQRRGPGCSSIAYGAAQELGPFLVRGYGANLTRNAYAWNKAVNLLFLEAPVGVGFSYTNKTADLGRLGDRVTAQDSYTFLLNWLAKFPEFKGRDFYIAGESYAGHYVPQLADLIYEGNKAAGRGSIINLKGFMIGNAVLNDETDQLGMVEYAWSHAIISDELHSAVTRECDSFKEEADGGRPGKGCSSAVRAFMGAFDDIDIYSIYTP